MKNRVQRLSPVEWINLVGSGKVEDISHELPDSFLLVGQWMRAKVKLEGKVYKVTGWCVGYKYVELVPVEN